MKNNLYHRLLLMCFATAVLHVKSAVAQPAYSPSAVELKVPVFLPGVMQDAAARTASDTLYYRLQGQAFVPPWRVDTSAVVAVSDNPWATLSAMAGAYLSGDAARISELYDAASRPRLSALLGGELKDRYLQYLQSAVRSGLSVLAGFEYQRGFLAFSQDRLFGLHSNFLMKEGNAYRLSALNDSSATSWNLGLFYKFKPGPMIPLGGKMPADSLAMSDSVLVQLTVPDSGRWIAVIPDKPMQPVSRLVQDNGINDTNPQPGKVAFWFRGDFFPMPGSYNFYLASFNFPVQRTSANFFVEPAACRIKITGW